ncbi:MAG TPA: amidohydrolase [Anaerolineae bacterium]|nr:amidohydrolase [Anaerolineae bacterium]HCM97087.1 amidohydrolase [Anaerolineae bacterium]
MDMIDYINEAQQLFPYTQSIRRDFHKHPELGFRELRTSEIISRELNELGLEVRNGVAETGVVALLKGIKPGPVVLIRADMDALPIVEETNAEYASTVPGVMHACGHDGHSAILLTVAKILNAHKDDMAGTVKLVFQPAEEGLGGAERMIIEGVLKEPKPDVTLALHLWNEKPVGWIGISQGSSMAGAEIFKIKIRGKGGHGAAPHLANDPILASAQIITALQSITSRNIPPLKSAVVSVCTIHGGEAFNVIPQEVQLAGTIRTFDLEVRDKVLERFEVIVFGMAETMGCQAEIELNRLTPAVINHFETAARVQKVAQTLYPSAYIDNNNYTTMGSEDMAFMMELVPGCFFFIGSANSEKKLDASHHHPLFDFDEQALSQAVAILAASAMDILNNPLS